MKAITESAPGKLILLGEHAVVYGQPAIAVPLKHLRAEATVEPTTPEEPVAVSLEDFASGWKSGDECAPDEANPFVRLLELATADGKISKQGWRLRVHSRLPIGCGLGSSAAVCAAAFKAINSAFGLACSPEELAQRVYETERIMHGTPSGIDNTVIALEQPVCFQRGQELRLLKMPAAEGFLVVGYTGVRHKTREVVGDVRKSWVADPIVYDALFAEIGQIAQDGAQAFEEADWRKLGELLNRNQALLKRLDVSSAKLEQLIAAARQAGALGAKLSGAGRGGCMVALAETAAQAHHLQSALEKAGAIMSITSGLH